MSTYLNHFRSAWFWGNGFVKYHFCERRYRRDNLR